MHTTVGTPGYQTPEVTRLVSTMGREQYDAKCDVWSFGCLVFNVLTSKLPFSDSVALADFCRDDSLFETDLLRSAKVSDEVSKLVQILLVADPARRLSSDEAASECHSWFHSPTTAASSDAPLVPQLSEVKDLHHCR